MSSIDVVDVDGQPVSLALARGRVTVVDVCAAWSDACLMNARAVSDACTALCGPRVFMVTILFDEAGKSAVASYQNVLAVKQPVVRPGPRTLAGQSALGDVSVIPRLVIFDADGVIVEDIKGSIIGAEGLETRLRELGVDGD